MKLSPEQLEALIEMRHDWLIEKANNGKIVLDQYWLGYINGLVYTLKLLKHNQPNLNVQD